VNTILDKGTIRQQVDLLVRLTDEVANKLFLIKVLGIKVATADQQDLLNEQEQERYLASGEKLRNIIRYLPKAFPSEEGK